MWTWLQADTLNNILISSIYYERTLSRTDVLIIGDSHMSTPDYLITTCTMTWWIKVLLSIRSVLVGWQQENGWWRPNLPAAVQSGLKMDGLRWKAARTPWRVHLMNWLKLTNQIWSLLWMPIPWLHTISQNCKKLDMATGFAFNQRH